MSHFHEAQQLMRNFPEVARRHTVQEVMDIWEAYSNDYAAGWLIPNMATINEAFFQEVDDEALPSNNGSGVVPSPDANSKDLKEIKE